MSSLWNAYASGYKDSFAYNGLSTRVSKTEQQRLMPPTPGTTTAFVRDGAGVTAPVVKDSFAMYTPGVSERRNGVSTFSHAGIKNVDAQSNVSQVVSATREYDAFGNLTNSSGTWSGPFGYGGPYGYQESAYHPYKLLGHRYYDPTTGRFLTRDKAKDGRNWYAYCDNNPLRFADSDGRTKIEVPPAPPGVNLRRDIARLRSSIRRTSPQPAVVPVTSPLPEAGAPDYVGVAASTLVLFADAVRTGSEFDYKGKDGRYEAYGNFSYGALGASLGIPEWLLLVAAGAYQIKEGKSAPAYGFPGFGANGDDPRDQYWIRMGFRYYHEVILAK